MGEMWWINDYKSLNYEKKLQLHKNIMKSFEELYFCVADINLPNDYIDTICCEQFISEVLGVGGTASIRLQEIVMILSNAEYQEQLSDFFDIYTLRERTGNTNILQTEFVSQFSGWCMARFVVTDRDKDNNATGLIFTLKDINTEKLWEIEKSNTLRVDFENGKKSREDLREELKKSYETVKRANEIKSEFLSHMSHDVRTPMNAIIGMTDVAAANINDRTKVEDCLNKIKESSNYLLRLLNEIIDMNKIEIGTVDLSEDEINLTNLVQEMIRSIKTDIRAKEQHLSVKINQLEHKQVIADSVHIQQVFINIISNAIKYTPQGGKINIEVAEIANPQPGIGTFEFVFEDTGIGIQPENIDRIFEPFEREEDSRISAIHGTGLGLAIARNIVNMMGGNIRVESVPHEGSKFTVTINLKIVKENVHKKKKEPKDVFKNKRVLIVEDNELNRMVLKDILRITGCESESAVNGKEGVELFESKPEYYYDLILMDIQMPIMNGLECARAIRAMDRADAKGIPIVAVTANTFSEDVEATHQAGMNEHIGKPVDVEKLKKTQSRWFTGDYAKEKQRRMS